MTFNIIQQSNSLTQQKKEDTYLKIVSQLALNKENPFEGLKQLALLAGISKEWNKFIKENPKVELQIYRPLLIKYAGNESVPDGMRFNWRVLAKAYVNKTLARSIGYKKETIEVPKLKTAKELKKCVMYDIGCGRGFLKDWFCPMSGGADNRFLMNAKTKLAINFPWIGSQESAFDANEKQIVIGHVNGKIRSLDALTEKEQWTCNAGGHIRSLSLYKDTLYSLTKGGQLRGWYIANGKPKPLPDTYLGLPPSRYMSRQEHHLILLHSDDKITIRDLRTGKDNEIRYSPCEEADRYWPPDGYGAEYPKTLLDFVEVSDRYIALLFHYTAQVYLHIYDYTQESKEPIVQQFFGINISKGNLRIKEDFAYLVYAKNQTFPAPSTECFLGIVNLKTKEFRQMLLKNEDISMPYSIGGVINVNPDVYREILDEPTKISLQVIKNKEIISYEYQFAKEDLLFVKKTPEIEEPAKVEKPLKAKEPVVVTPSSLQERIQSVVKKFLEKIKVIFHAVEVFIWKHKRVIILTGLLVTSLALGNHYLRRRI